MSEDGLIQLVGLVMAAVMVIPMALSHNRGRVMVRLGVWLAVILGLTLAYIAFGPGGGGPR